MTDDVKMLEFGCSRRTWRSIVHVGGRTAVRFGPALVQRLMIRQLAQPARSMSVEPIVRVDARPVPASFTVTGRSARSGIDVRREMQTFIAVANRMHFVDTTSDLGAFTDECVAIAAIETRPTAIEWVFEAQMDLACRLAAGVRTNDARRALALSTAKARVIGRTFPDLFPRDGFDVV